MLPLLKLALFKSCRLSFIPSLLLFSSASPSHSDHSSHSLKYLCLLYTLLHRFLLSLKMKSFTSIQLAAAGMLSLLSVAHAQSLCAVNCFQSVIAEHPPLTCTEDSMYLCFCKSTSLQGYFIDCAYNECSSEAEAAVAFGVNICSGKSFCIILP